MFVKVFEVTMAHFKYLHYKTAAVSLVLPSNGGFLGTCPGAPAANPSY